MPRPERRRIIDVVNAQVERVSILIAMRAVNAVKCTGIVAGEGVPVERR